MLRHNRRRGITFIELLVALPLMLLLSAVVYRGLVSTTRSTAKYTAQAQLQELATVTLRRLERDLSETPAAGLAIGRPEEAGSPTVISMHALADVDSNGVRIYADHLKGYVYEPAQGLLIYREWRTLPDGTPLDPLEPCRPTPDHLRRMATESIPRERVVMRDVAAFSLTSDAPADQIGDPLTLRILLRRQAVSAEIEEFDLRRVFTLRN